MECSFAASASELGVQIELQHIDAGGSAFDLIGAEVFQAREHVTMPPPGDMHTARLHVELRDLVWDYLYVPISGAVAITADRLNVLQFLTIRRYLTLVFLALVTLLLVLAIWP